MNSINKDRPLFNPQLLILAMDSRQMSKAILARKVGIPLQELKEILSKDHGIVISFELADRFSSILNYPASFFYREWKIAKPSFCSSESDKNEDRQ